MLEEAAAGATVEDVCRRHGTHEQSSFHRRGMHGGMEISDARRLRSLEGENRRPMDLVADLKVDRQALKAVLSTRW